MCTSPFPPRPIRPQATAKIRAGARGRESRLRRNRNTMQSCGHTSPSLPSHPPTPKPIIPWLLPQYMTWDVVPGDNLRSTTTRRSACADSKKENANMWCRVYVVVMDARQKGRFRQQNFNDNNDTCYIERKDRRRVVSMVGDRDENNSLFQLPTTSEF